MTRTSLALLILLPSLAGTSCGGSSGSSGCQAGAIEVCACADGSTAKRVCTDARIWTPCACHEPDVTPTPDDAAPDVPEPAEPAPEPQPEPVSEPVPEVVDAEPLSDAELPDLPAEGAAEAGPEPFEIHYPDNCAPDCGTRVCGPDGCGGTCGTCDCGHECQQGACAWIGCDGRPCGLDGGGCGVQCGGCYAHANSQCTEVFGGTLCGCQPNCEGKLCGDDGCGESCGTCQAGLVCKLGGKCVPDCTPACGATACGDNGCGGSCGLCTLGKHCSPAGQCVECLSSADCAAPLACLAMTCVPVVP